MLTQRPWIDSLGSQNWVVKLRSNQNPLHIAGMYWKGYMTHSIQIMRYSDTSLNRLSGLAATLNLSTCDLIEFGKWPWALPVFHFITYWIFTGLGNSDLPPLTSGGLQPPPTLQEFPSLATYLNCILEAFNDLRLCCPVSLSKTISDNLTESLNCVVAIILEYYHMEEAAFTSNERGIFARYVIHNICCFGQYGVTKLPTVPFLSKVL